jgi:hypothetical protein
MENNFGQILLQLVRTNKDKFLGLLRRNGVLVNTNVSNEVLTNTILKAMQKSESFKKEAILLMGVLMAESNDGAFSNYTGFSTLPTFGTGVGYTSTLIPTATTTTSETTTTTNAKPKKDFADTTVGTIFDKLFTIGNAYLTNKELDVRKAEAQAGTVIATSGSNTGVVTPTPPKSNTALYVGLGLGGLALVGALVYVIAKKK